MKLSTKIMQKQQYIVAFVAVIFLMSIYLLTPGDGSYWLQYWWMFPIAFMVALMVNTAGISGASLFVPFFILIFPLITGISLAPIDTVKLGLITESFGLSSSALAFLSFGLVDTTLASRAIVRAIPFVIVGVFFVFLIPKSVLYVIVAVLLLLAVFLMRYERVLKQRRIESSKLDDINESVPDGEQVTITSKDKKRYTYCRTKSGAKKRFIGYGLGGVFQGAAGFGIGELGIISMILTKIPTRIAIGTSHFIVATTAIVASIIHFILASSLSGGSFPWNIPFMTVPAVILGGQLAPYVAAKLSSKYLERFVSILFIIIAFALFSITLNF